MASLLSDKKKAENLAQARESLAKAKSKTQSNWKSLRFAPDWEAAARHYREAVKLFKISGDHSATIAALRESAIAHKEIDSVHTAAADLEAAAQLLKDEQHDMQLAAQLYQESGQLYASLGTSRDKAAGALLKAAECLADSDLAAAIELIKQACAIFEDDPEKNAVFHDAVFKKAICFCVQRDKLGTARQLILRQMKLQAMHLNPFESDLYKNILSLVVLRMQQGKGEEAREDLLKHEQTERFARSDECLAANELIAAWEDDDAEKWAATLKKAVFKNLVHPIAVMARKMQMPEEGAGLGHQVQQLDINAEGGAAASAVAQPAKKKGKKKVILDEEPEGDDGEIDLR